GAVRAVARLFAPREIAALRGVDGAEALEVLCALGGLGGSAGKEAERAERREGEEQLLHGPPRGPPERRRGAAAKGLWPRYATAPLGTKARRRRGRASGFTSAGGCGRMGALGALVDNSRFVNEAVPVVDEDIVARLRGLMADVSEEGEDLAGDL